MGRRAASYSGETAEALGDSDRSLATAQMQDSPTFVCALKSMATAKSQAAKRKHRRKKGSSKAGGRDTYLHHLDLGDSPSPRDMATNSDPGEIDGLRTHAFAFVLRSDRSWTYAILAGREKDAMLFVVDTEGNTKNLSRDRWPTMVRPVRRRGEKTKADAKTCSPSPERPSEIVDGMPPPPFECDHGENRRESV